MLAAQQERKIGLDTGRIGTVFRVRDQVMLQTKTLLDSDATDMNKQLPL